MTTGFSRWKARLRIGGCVKRIFGLILTAVLVAVFVPANASGASITVTEINPTTITIATDLTGLLTSQFMTLSLVHGYYNPRAPYLVSQGPNVETNDTGSIPEYSGALLVGDSVLDVPNSRGVSGSVWNAINWLDPESTPGNPLYDTLDFDGPAPAPAQSFLFTSDNAVPTFGIQGAGICYGDSGFPVDCPIVPYGTVVNAFYTLEWDANNVGYDDYGAITVTFIDDAAGAPEPATWMMMLSGIGGAALLRRRLRTQASLI
jgi:hypothetical protein